MNSREGQDENGIAYAFMMIVVFLILAAVSYLCIGIMTNALLEPVNDWIASGDMNISQQTKDAIANSVGFIGFIPAWALIGCFVWSMNRGASGGTAPYESFYVGWITFVLLCLTSLLLAFAGGIVIDNLFAGLDDAGYIGFNSKLPSEWETAQEGSMYMFINLFYFGLYCLPILGLLVYIQGIARRTQGSMIYGGY